MIDKQDFKLDGFYTINEEGILTDENNDTHTISTSGTKPSGGYLGIENNEVVYECLNIGDYKVMLEDGNVTAERGKCGEIRIFNVGNPLYFNPGSSVKGVTDNVGECNVEDYSADYVNSGCMKWYVINGTGTSVDLLLDHDTTVGVAWSSDGSNANGPITLLKQLQDDTENWSNNLIRNDSYSVKKITDSANQSINYTIDYSGYKARVITVEELAQITGQEKTKLQDISEGFSLESRSWLKDNTNLGYWTSSPKVGDSSSAWFVFFVTNRLSSSSVSNSNLMGLRPVITVSKSQLIQ